VVGDVFLIDLVHFLQTSVL
jgi:hypothetical protein